jgi:hypothetical protein
MLHRKAVLDAVSVKLGYSTAAPMRHKKAPFALTNGAHFLF